MWAAAAGAAGLRYYHLGGLNLNRPIAANEDNFFHNDPPPTGDGIQPGTHPYNNGRDSISRRQAMSNANNLIKTT